MFFKFSNFHTWRFRSLDVCKYALHWNDRYTLTFWFFRHGDPGLVDRPIRLSSAGVKMAAVTQFWWIGLLGREHRSWRIKNSNSQGPKDSVQNFVKDCEVDIETSCKISFLLKKEMLMTSDFADISFVSYYRHWHLRFAARARSRLLRLFLKCVCVNPVFQAFVLLRNFRTRLKLPCMRRFSTQKAAFNLLKLELT